MTAQRWVLNRAGVFNFWYYTDEIFELSEGRLIFRGANGSGKSVTMQSFLPLVLDGDKRPSRLDPFGSRDRKIEYYLLGEMESGINDRTGYLYLEFSQPDTGKVMTIGIGLRARRGAAQVGFWGFAITDQRRIGKDLFLYDADLFEKQGKKVPLDRTELEAVIGEGGRVVREQGEYRQLVNQLLFGFDDIEAYKDLLELLIQLRSPKLSKEFKPSTIYGILNQALPPLSDEDLRPLSEVLEDMDEISDRLEELKLHRAEAQKLDSIYNQYNEMRLYELAAQVTDDAKEQDQKELEVHEQEREWNKLRDGVDQTDILLSNSKQTLSEKETQIDYLNRSEAMEKQQELQTMEERLNELQKEIGRSETRLQANEEEKRRKENRAKAAQEQLEKHHSEQREVRDELVSLSQEMEFKDHYIYDRQWLDGGRPEEESLWNSWRRDVAGYRMRLKEIHALSIRERESASRAREAEESMSAAREKRDAAERNLQAKEEALGEAILHQEDALLAWFKGLQHLPLSEEAWRTMIHRLHKYPELDYDAVTAPVKEAWEIASSAATTERIQIEHERKQRSQEQNQLKAEWDEWKSYREPEPERTEARIRSRRRRKETAGGHGLGAPLYACCEFRPDVDEATRAVLENVLHRSGLLDAWISPVELDVMEQEEEMWLKPSPSWFGHTLVDYLEPVVPVGSGLIIPQIEDALRTVQMGEETESGAYVTESGQFILGPLTGQVASKSRAEWIGVETRKQTRLAEMQRLEEAISAVEEQIAGLNERLATLASHIEQMKQERDALPSDETLRKADLALRHARAELEHAEQIEAVLSEKYKEAVRQWRELQRNLLENTAQWTRLKKEKDFQGALDCLQDYERKGMDLKTSFTISSRIKLEAHHLLEEMNLLTERIEMEEETLQQFRLQEKKFQAAVETLSKLVQEMGALDVYRQLQQLKNECILLKQTIEDCNTQLLRLNGDLGAAAERLKRNQIELEAREEQLQKSVERLQREWKWKLVDFGSEHSLHIINMETQPMVIRTAQTVRSLYRTRYESRRKEQVMTQLQETFALAKNALLDYSLEQRYDEEGDRIFIESLRDRNQPWTPYMLLGELIRMEEEQRLLIDEKDRELYEQILIHSVGRAIKDKINRAEQWVAIMNRFMEERKTSSGLILSLEWTPRAARNERELDTEKLVRLLRKDPNTLLNEELEQMVEHFRSRIRWAKEDVEEGESLRKWIQELLDYRGWFTFTLYYRKGSQPRRELTDSRFNVLSGGEKAMAMYIPLFAATDSRYKDSRESAPRIISLDEAFAGVDDENMRDMFGLLTDMKFDYMMTSQVLWGCYDTVPSLSIYEIYRPLDVDFVTLISYYWNGYQRKMIEDGDWSGLIEVAASKEE